MIRCKPLSVRPFAAALSLSVSLLSAGAGAAERPDASVRVTVGDLDFSKARDVALFARRIDQAARTLCRPDDQLDFLERSACYRGVHERVLQALKAAQRRQLFAASGALGVGAGRAERP